MTQKYFNKQKDCFDNSNGNKCFIAQDYKGGNGAKKHTSFHRIEDFLLYKNTIDITDNTFYEILTDSCIEIYDIDGHYKDENTQLPSKIYSDEEGNPLTDKEIALNLINTRIEFNNKLQEQYPEIPTLEPKHFYIKRTPDPSNKKTSLHILIRNGMKFNNNGIEQKIFQESFVNFIIKGEYKTKTDPKIYSSNQKIRVLGSHKEGQPQRCSTIFNEYYKHEIPDERLYYASYMTGDEKTWPMKLFEKDKVIREKAPLGVLTTNTEITRLINLIVESISDNSNNVNNEYNILCDEKTDKLIYNNWYKLVLTIFNYTNTEQECDCLFKDILFHLYRHASDVDVDTMFDNLFVWKDKYENLTVNSLHFWASQHRDYPLLSKLDCAMLIEKTEKLRDDRFTSFGTIVDMNRVFCNFDLRTRVTICTSDTGTGKTTRTGELIQDYKYVVFITTRVALTTKLENDFKIQSYKNDIFSKKSAKIRLSKYPKIIICLNSFNKLVIDIPEEEYANLLLVLDETSMVFQTLTSEFLLKKTTGYKEVIDKFGDLMDKSARILCTDATMNVNDILQIQNWCNVDEKDTTIFTNSYKSDYIQNCKAIIYSDSNEWTTKVLSHIGGDKNVVICCAGVKNLIIYKKMIEKAYPDKTIGIYHGSDKYDNDDKNDKDEFIKSLGEDVPTLRYNVLLYNGTFDRGISIDYDHYDMYFINYDYANIMNPSTIYQLMRRVRKVSTGEYHILVKNSFCIKPEIDYEQIEENFKKYHNLDSYLQEFQFNNKKKVEDKILTFLDSYVEDTSVEYPYKGKFYNCVLSIKKDWINFCKNHIFLLIQILKTFGFNVVKANVFFFDPEKIEQMEKEALLVIRKADSVRLGLITPSNDPQQQTNTEEITDIEIVQSLIEEYEDYINDNVQPFNEWDNIHIARIYKLNPFKLTLDTNGFLNKQKIIYEFTSFIKLTNCLRNNTLFLEASAEVYHYTTHCNDEEAHLKKIVRKKSPFYIQCCLLKEICIKIGIDFTRIDCLDNVKFVDLNFTDNSLNNHINKLNMIWDIRSLCNKKTKKVKDWGFKDFLYWIKPKLTKLFINITTSNIPKKCKGKTIREYTFSTNKKILDILEECENRKIDSSQFIEKINGVETKPCKGGCKRKIYNMLNYCDFCLANDSNLERLTFSKLKIC